MIDKDNTFIAALVEEFNSKLNSRGENMDDELFLDLVKALQQYDVEAPPTLQPYEGAIGATKCKESNKAGAKKCKKDAPATLSPAETKLEKDYVSMTVGDPALPSIIVFQAISSRYPELGSTDELIKKYKKLTAVKEKFDFTPNIDGPNAAAVPCDRALHSYKSLLCR